MGPDLCELHEWLLQSKQLPAEWACSVSSPVVNLVLCKMSTSHPKTVGSTDVPYMVKIATDFTWTTQIGHNNISLDENELLNGLPHSLHSVESVIRVLRVLDGSKLCVGNSDAKFSRLIERRNGKFMDNSSKYSQLLGLCQDQ